MAGEERRKGAGVQKRAFSAAAVTGLLPTLLVCCSGCDTPVACSGHGMPSSPLTLCMSLALLTDPVCHRSRSAMGRKRELSTNEKGGKEVPEPKRGLHQVTSEEEEEGGGGLWTVQKRARQREQVDARIASMVWKCVTLRK